MHHSAATPIAEIIAAYSWTTGSTCFRCGAEVETAPVGWLVIDEELLAVDGCPTCAVVMERERELAALRYGWPYAPGTPVPSAAGGH
jgi:hypothetical protein